MTAYNSRMDWDPDEYFDEFVRYYEMAKIQQHECNLGSIPHKKGTVRDPLMMNVELYDVVNIRYAGFKQVLLDLWYGDSHEHPYIHKLHDVRKPICKKFSGARDTWGLKEWLYIWLIHAITGSGINYAKKPSGYNNTILPYLHGTDNLRDIVAKVREILNSDKPAYTSVGYQFPRFPKPGDDYKRGGDKYLIEFAPHLVTNLAEWLETHPRQPAKMRDVREFMIGWNKRYGLHAYRFQYAAMIGDMANWIPELVDRESDFFHGSNATECLSYITGGTRAPRALDGAAHRFREATGGRLYDLEDVCCDAIRWIENYIRPGADYDDLDRDKIWNTSKIKDHPFGRQKPMLSLGLIESFNKIRVHPSDNYVLKNYSDMTVMEYQRLARVLA